MVDHSVHVVVDQQRVCRHQKNSKYSRISQSVTSPRKRLHSLAFIWDMNRTNPSPNASLKKSSASSSATASHRLVGSFGASAAYGSASTSGGGVSSRWMPSGPAAMLAATTR